MAKSPPAFKRTSDPKVGTGSAKAFSDDKIQKCRKVETRHPSNLRDSFSRKYYMTPAGDHGLPEEVNTWKTKRPKTDKHLEMSFNEDARSTPKGRTVSRGPRKH